MSEERIPINEFRAHTAQILRTLQKTKATYVLTNRGEPVAEVVPYGTPLRKRTKFPILGIFEAEDYTQPWDEEGITEQEYEDRERAARIAYQEARAEKIHRSLPQDEDEVEPAG